MSRFDFTLRLQLVDKSAKHGADLNQIVKDVAHLFQLNFLAHLNLVLVNETNDHDLVIFHYHRFC